MWMREERLGVRVMDFEDEGLGGWFGVGDRVEMGGSGVL